MNNEALLRQVAVCSKDGCFIWPRRLTTRGRGRVRRNSKRLLAHRWVWEELIGPIPAGMCLCHHCDVPACVNPKHLYVGTQADNMRDMVIRKRTFACRDPEGARKNGLRNRGDNNARRKLSSGDVSEIRIAKLAPRVLAEKYGVTRRHIYRILRCDYWPGEKA